MRILMKNPNFLILDEPTNDLDIDTLNVLEEFLVNYPGVLVLVTHDRYLLDKLTDQLFILEGNGSVLIYNGNYSDYRNQIEEQKAQAKRDSKAEAKKQASPTPEPVVAKKSKLNFKEQKELQDLDKGIIQTEGEIKKLTEQLNSDITDHAELARLAGEIEKLNNKLEQQSMRWLELSELAGV